MRILVAEDDRPVASFLKKGLEAEHYAVDIVPDGQEALYLAEEYDYDLVLLDLVLPKMDGFQVLRKIRNRKKNLPVLVLTGRTRVEDRVKGLDLGADDYMVKPFAFLELTARVRALLRRGDGHVDFKLRVDDLEMNLVERTVDRSERRIELTPKEFGLLEYLMRNQGRAVSRPMIIEHVWNFSFDTMTNVVDVYINYLRKKVDGGEAQKLIHTVRGVGYRIGNSQ
ncbi:MAG TPA: response regulator transcription factor [Terriglobia bacterium]|nr:response regulator transcription factor [Terriglobia bacterium]